MADDFNTLEPAWRRDLMAVYTYHCDQCHKRIEGSPSVKDAKQAAAAVDEGPDELFRKLGPPDA